MIKRAKRIENLPPYLFARIDQLKEEAIKRGIDVISLGIGDPDRTYSNACSTKIM